MSFRILTLLGVVILTSGFSILGSTKQTLPFAVQASKQDSKFEGMGHHTRKISTVSEAAQAHFNQALTWAFAFNHDEAIRSLMKATK